MRDGVLVLINLQSMTGALKKRFLLSSVRLVGSIEQKIDLEDWSQFGHLVRR